MFFCPNCNNSLNIIRDQSTVQNIIKPNSDQSLQIIAPAYYKCTNCGYKKDMEPGTMILSRAAEKVISEFTDQEKYKDMIYDKTLPRTRNYTCPNDACQSHTDYKLRDAVWFKANRQSYAIKYVCSACRTVW